MTRTDPTETCYCGATILAGSNCPFCASESDTCPVCSLPHAWDGSHRCATSGERRDEWHEVHGR